MKRGMVFISDFKKMEKVYFMAHPSGWDIKYTFSLYYCGGSRRGGLAPSKAIPILFREAGRRRYVGRPRKLRRS